MAEQRDNSHRVRRGPVGQCACLVGALPWVAQSSSGSLGGNLAGLLVLSAIMLVLLIALVVAWRVARNYLFADDESNGATSFTLGDLRDMHRRGDLTDEEFERAKALLIAQERRRMAVDDGTDEDEDERDDMQAEEGMSDSDDLDKPDDDDDEDESGNGLGSR